MSSETIIEVVDKLIGKVNPAGETNTDDERFENLKVLCEVINHYVSVIDDVQYLNRNAHQFSIKRAVSFAGDFLTKELGICDKN